jgi:membrane-associated phospholipid phosphatase
MEKSIFEEQGDPNGRSPRSAIAIAGCGQRPQADLVKIQARSLDPAISRLARRRPPGRVGLISAKLASPWAATVEGLAFALALRASGRPGLPAALAAPATLLVGNAVKTLVSRPRPGFARFARKGRQSFPSTHVAGPVALLACLWALAPRSRGWRAALAFGGAAALFVARERVCAGEHWASDVLAGAALGAVIGAGIGRAGKARSSGRLEVSAP